ncbi:hypothetical protein Ssi03_37290 [Sphaerisporangium siamense]|uniref:Uncharacterized protein n=1 Tax=Sphaerisporangium siamense TaxID=795645 RepID=A0A7W7D7U2_9ACTN|nr:hypothetical protein [Sphaerisporangium siamense]MBB4701614.1 hypothetical protein [Sphaerisporangium siamense]GII85739.1 hypothetical protein Ssi03_37290 [Sphaerisporangium siamense]
MTIIEDITVNGDDSQNVFGNTVGGDLIVQMVRKIQGRPSLVLSEQEVRDKVAVYVPALNHDLIAAVLARDNVVALSGPQGVGKTATAIAVLRHVCPGLRIQHFSAGDDDLEEVGARTQARGYLVRARDENPSRLRAFLEALRVSGGFAVVMGTAVEQRRFADFLTTIELDVPPAETVYLSHLTRRGLGNSRWSYWSRGLELLKGASPGEASRLAALADQIPREGGDEAEVEHAYLGWAAELRVWFDHHPKLLDQTLMIAAATIEPGDESQVYAAALSLARRLDIKPPGAGLAWTPTTGLCELLETVREDERIVFRRRGYAGSVLRHVCDEYPLARMQLLSWVSDLPTDEVLALESKPAYRLVEKFADLAAGYNATEKITQMAGLWAGDNRSDLAYIALAETCLHPTVGGRIRTKLYEWSTQRQTPQTLKLTIARVCEVLGQVHLSIALTRLKHLGTHGNAQVHDEVVQVALSLAGIDPGTVFVTALNWARTALTKPRGEAARLLKVAMRLLLDLLPRFGADELHAVLQIIDLHVTNGDSRLRGDLLAWCRDMADDHRIPVLRMALACAGTLDDGSAAVRARKTFGTELFLALLFVRDAYDVPAILDDSARIDPLSWSSPWRIALSGRFPTASEALSLWLRTAADREDLRAPLTATLALAARGDPAIRQHLTVLVRKWDAGIHHHRPVKEAVLTRILLPDWHRWILVVWVRLRTAVAPGL